MRKHPFDRDRMNNMHPRPVANAAMQTIDALQRHHLAEAQVMGLAAAFVLMCERYDVPAQDVFTASKNLMVASEEDRTEFKAVRDYMKYEV